MSNKSIGIVTAILININIIIGAGFFINIRPLSALAGSWGAASYLCGALLLLPLVLCMAELAVFNPLPGGIYIYSKKYLNSFAGFVSGWFYFVAKATSIAAIVSTVAKVFCSSIPALAGVSYLPICFVILASLAAIHLIGVSLGGRIQYLFISVKLIPLVTAFFVSFFCLKFRFLDGTALAFEELFKIMPIVVFAFSSFEVTCSIAHLIKDPAKNIRFIVLSSFFFVTTVYTVLQFGIFGAMGSVLATTDRPIYALLFEAFPHFPMLAEVIASLVVASMTAGVFGLLTSNYWNLFALANDNLLPGKKYLTRLTSYGIPWVCLGVEFVVAGIIVYASRDQVALQTMSIFCVSIAYFLSAISAVRAMHQETGFRLYSAVPFLAVASALYLISICFNNILASGISLSFSAVLLVGMLLAVWQRRCMENKTI